jgi:hypothetical protein
VSKQKAALSID